MNFGMIVCMLVVVDFFKLFLTQCGSNILQALWATFQCATKTTNQMERRKKMPMENLWEPLDKFKMIMIIDWIAVNRFFMHTDKKKHILQTKIEREKYVRWGFDVWKHHICKCMKNHFLFSMKSNCGMKMNSKRRSEIEWSNGVRCTEIPNVKIHTQKIKVFGI